MWEGANNGFAMRPHDNIFLYVEAQGNGCTFFYENIVFVIIELLSECLLSGCPIKDSVRACERSKTAVKRDCGSWYPCPRGPSFNAF